MRKYLTVMLMMILMSVSMICGVGCDADSSETLTTNAAWTENDANAKLASVNVDGTTVDGWNAYFLPAVSDSTPFSRLSVLETMQYFGVKAKKSNDRYVKLSKGLTVYYLDVENGTLSKTKKEEDDILIPAPGTTGFYRHPTGEDVITDDLTMKYALQEFDIFVSFNSDYEQGTVFIRTYSKP